MNVEILKVSLISFLKIVGFIFIIQHGKIGIKFKRYRGMIQIGRRKEDSKNNDTIILQ
jgi:hypothetical protein